MLYQGTHFIVKELQQCTESQQSIDLTKNAPLGSSWPGRMMEWPIKCSIKVLAMK